MVPVNSVKLERIFQAVTLIQSHIVKILWLESNYTQLMAPVAASILNKLIARTIKQLSTSHTQCSALAEQKTDVSLKRYGW